MEILISKALYQKWLKKGWQYYHTDDGTLKEVFFIGNERKSTIVFKHGFKGRLLLDTTNVTVDDELAELIEETRKELGLK